MIVSKSKVILMSMLVLMFLWVICQKQVFAEGYTVETAPAPPQTESGEAPVLYEKPAVISLDKTSYKVGEEVIIYIDGYGNSRGTDYTYIEFDVPDALSLNQFSTAPTFEKIYNEHPEREILSKLQYKDARSDWHDMFWESPQNLWHSTGDVPYDSVVQGLCIYIDHVNLALRQTGKAVIKFTALKGYDGDIVLTTRNIGMVQDESTTQMTKTHLLILDDGISENNGTGKETETENAGTSPSDPSVSTGDSSSSVPSAGTGNTPVDNTTPKPNPTGNTSVDNKTMEPDSSEDTPADNMTTKPDSAGNTSAGNKVSKPKKTSITGFSRGKGQITAKWKKTKGVSGYQVQCATNKKFTKGKKTKTVSGYKKTKATFKKLKAKKTYYVRIRTFKKVNGTKVYSSWSKARKIKTK